MIKVPQPSFVNKKKILILSSGGGGGHEAAAFAATQVLGDDYVITRYSPLQGFNLEEKFNDSLNSQAAINLWFLSRFQRILELFQGFTAIHYRLDEKIKEIDPDLIISVFPVGNYLTLNLARRHGIPMLVLPTDLSFRHFFHFMKLPGPRFKIGLPFEDAELRKGIAKKFVDENYELTGFPIRSEFCVPPRRFLGDQPFDEVEVRRKDLVAVELGLGVARGSLSQVGKQDKLITIMIGSVGVPETTIDLASEILNNLPVRDEGSTHLVVLTGRNTELLERMNEIKAKGVRPGIQLHPLGFQTAKFIAPLFRLSEILISKPGGVTLNEAVASGVYTLYAEGPGDSIPWEYENRMYAEKKGWGEKVERARLIEQIENRLHQSKRIQQDYPGREFAERLQELVSRMINS